MLRSAYSAVSLAVAGLALSTIFLYFVCTRWRTSNGHKISRLPLPPSPKGRLPILGNLLSIPSELEWKKYHQWCEELGE